MERIRLFFITLPFVLWGYFIDYYSLMIAGEIMFSLMCCFIDYRKGFSNVTFITVYSFFTLTYCYGNFLVVNAIDTPMESDYNYYLVKEHIATALLFTYIGNVFCQIGFVFFQMNVKEVYGFKRLNLNVNVSYIDTLSWLLMIYNLSVFLQWIPMYLPVGITISILFFITRYAAKINSTRIIVYCLIIVFFESLNGIMYAYLRSTAIIPFVAFIIAYLYGKNNIRALLNPLLSPIYIAVVIFIFIFPFLGKIRTTSRGAEKFDMVINRIFSDEEKGEPFSYLPTTNKPESLGARISNINQTTQVVRVVDEDDYYRGGTLAYLSYAFIPRFLWEDKPLIMQGRWFAIRIGKAYVHDNGQANNSINMTCPGELYMNFSYPGVILGMFLVGMLSAYMWNISGFADSHTNILGSMFGLYLFYLATTTFGIDLQFMVTMISYFLIFQAINYIKVFFFKNQTD